MKNTVKIATRSSNLALWQAHWVKDQIECLFPEKTVELIHLKTKGDRILDSPLAKIGGKGLFVKELEIALLNHEADIAVHSMKDVPTELPEGLEISVITKRESPGDAFVSNQFASFESLPKNAVVGTSSLRRIAQMQRLRPDLVFKSLRGNVNTRLKKLDDSEYDGIILAAAGLIRLEMEHRITQLLSYEVSLPAIGQGAVCIESRVDDNSILDLIRPLAHQKTTFNVLSERALLKRLNGGCQVPLAGHAVIIEDQIHLTGMVASPDGSQYIKMTEIGPKDEFERIGFDLGEKLLAAGGREILARVGIKAD